MTNWPPLEPSDVLDRRANKTDPWHVGLMVTQDRAIAVAATLFPDDIADGSDCRAEHGRLGLPCNCCAYKNQNWIVTVRKVRAAMMEAFR